jgi:hypothetical protein
VVEVGYGTGVKGRIAGLRRMFKNRWLWKRGVALWDCYCIARYHNEKKGTND